MATMKDFEIRIRNGGDDAVAAMAELWETRKKILFDITDAFTRARWIPVSERMPADKEYVLTFSCSDHNGYIEMRVQQRRDGEWDYDETEPSHWMPLPAPPTGEK
jgi:hypothetical protein